MTALPNVTYEIAKHLKYITNNTKELLHNTKTKVEELEKILHQSHRYVDIHKDESDSFKFKIKEEIEVLTKMRGNIDKPCPNDCSNGKHYWALTISNDFEF